MAFAGLSVIVDGELNPYTESPVDAGGKSDYRLLVVQGFTRNPIKDNPIWPCRCIHSRPFIVGGQRWCLIYYPKGLSAKDSISIFLTSLNDDDDDGTANDDEERVVRARFRFSFIDQPELRPPFTRRCRICDFYPDSCDYDYNGKYRFFRRDVLERSRHFKDDSFVILCDVLVVDDDADTAEEEDDMATDTQEVQLPDMLQSHLSNLLTKEGTDVTFEVGDKKFAAHRSVLAARSAVFKEKLSSGTRDAVLKIDDMEPDVFGALLTFIYTDVFCGMDNEPKPVTWLLQLLKAADTYDLQKLRLICEEMLAGRFMDEDTMADIIEVAERRRCRWLKEMCLEFIKSHTRLLKIFTDDGLEEMIRTCSPSVLKELIAKFALPNEFSMSLSSSTSSS
ncbi:BTB/POZ and MATH domain-containing protein 3 [Brachypodium distachyon]|uniref:BTB/POZ and MATH domain-containing protein 3 n=1 Tax=Brachypodium distachyon TaxID=15368 RepID=UPI000234FD87|nr:BTB/POZ and MATH domain-containing protein 3 [Brachypodium distachyon]|eukprot:XP_003570857.1 BTB/POZ and MATH domain-containing protein 3 [Brachypodium distachyon]